MWANGAKNLDQARESARIAPYSLDKVQRWMRGIEDDIWKHADIETTYGKIAAGILKPTAI